MCSFLDDLVRRWRDGQYTLIHALDLNCRITAALVTNPTGSITTNNLDTRTGTFTTNGPAVVPITVPADICGGACPLAAVLRIVAVRRVL
jgi:hypothetical protein